MTPYISRAVVAGGRQELRGKVRADSEGADERWHGSADQFVHPGLEFGDLVVEERDLAGQGLREDRG